MEKAKPRTDKRPIKYRGCLMTVMCILIQYYILVNVHSWQIPNAVPGGQGIGLAYQRQMRITFTLVHNHKKLNCDGYSQRQKAVYKVECAWALLLTSHWQTFQYYFLYKTVLMSQYMAYFAANNRRTNQLNLHVKFFLLIGTH